jgi:hypothetical protein
MTRLARGFGQLLGHALFAAAIAVFAAAPAYYPIAPDQALLRLSFTHAGQRKHECRALTAEEVAKLPPNMRLGADCPRERLPLYVELELDGAVLFAARVAPAGLAHDRAASVYRKFVIAPGRHRLVARLRDSARTEGYDYERVADVEIRPRQNFVIDFRADAGGFVFENL